ncbi:uncharacterized protein LOC123537211 [Mercenaria mercenaria]|uniref:uncharacterized protein LOC123537211 n=1 Tax=Mercenaria mercenaria TaxID=6596 RepID=UPI001E1D5FEA|nr:uncharacterized protein LOC123537211 [Mercenaria mercenaria]
MVPSSEQQDSLIIYAVSNMTKTMGKKAKHKERLAQVVLRTCPALARFYNTKAKLYDVNRGDINDRRNIFSRCLFCFNTFCPSNCNIRLIPKPAVNKKIKRLLGRHSTHPSTLGNFQTKLVEDYIHGKNTVTVTCHDCKKTTKLAGQSRNEKQQLKLYMERQAGFKKETEGAVKVSARKERKKERRKLQRKRRAEETEDINAGLTLTDTVGSESNGALNNERTGQNKTELAEEDNPQIKQSENWNESQKSNKTETSTKQEDNVSEVMISYETSHRSARSNFEIQKKQTNRQTVDKNRINLFQQTVSGQKKSSSKKNKSKKQCQKLSNILKQEQKKQTEGTLADFLSGL